jgi:FdhD protein
VEEPLEIRIGGERAVVTMRTPGADLDLAAGFLLTEGWIQDFDDVGTMAYCADEKDPALRNIIEVKLLNATSLPREDTRTWANSSCGLCGKASIESIRQTCRPIDGDFRVNRRILRQLPGALERHQTNFGQTGGIHAAGLFDLDGNCMAVREDIGRHNAVDKVIGALIREGTLASATILMVSGRLGFEIAQKAVMAQIALVASVSAPSSLAIELAKEFGMTAIGFLRGGSMNIYSHPERLTR